MEALGRQILVELYGCTSSIINDKDYVEKSMLAGVEASGATIIAHNIHKFSPHGLSGVVIIAESHVSIHTWPEHHYAAVDVFTCGESIDPHKICNGLKKALQAQSMSSKELQRGLIDDISGKKLLFKPAKLLSDE